MPRSKSKSSRRASSYGAVGKDVCVWVNDGDVVVVPKADVMKLAVVCLATQGKYVMVPVKAYRRDLRELDQLRKLTEPRKR